MDNVVDSLHIEIESKSVDAENGINKLIKTLNLLKNVSSKVSGIDAKGIANVHGLAKAVDALSSAGQGSGLNNVISNLKKLCSLDFSNLNSANKAIQNVTDLVNSASNNTGVSLDTSALGSIVDTATAGTSQMAESVYEATASVKEAQSVLNGAANSADNTSSSVKETTSQVKTLSKVAGRAVKDRKSVV